jgi:hypothetical protein
MVHLLEGTSLVSVDRWSGDVFLKRSLRLEDSNFTFTIRIIDSAIKPHSITEEVTAQVIETTPKKVKNHFEFIISKMYKIFIDRE